MEHNDGTWKNQTLFAGIDLHRDKWVVTVRSLDVVLKTFVTGSDKDVLLRTFQHHWPGAEIKAVYEAGCFGYHLAEFLNANGINTIIVAPHTIPIAPGQFVKTDIIDSRKLALELSKGSLQGIYQRPPEGLFDRSVIRKRSQLVKRRVQIHNQIKGDLKFFGIDGENFLNKYWSKRTLSELKQLSVGTEPFRAVFAMFIQEYEFIRSQTKAIDKILIQMIQSEKYEHQMKLLLAIPGIGRLTAITLLVELGDMNRFSSTEKFASYLGLTPSEYSSGEHIHKGHLTGMGHQTLRALLIEAAWTAIKKDPVLLAKYQRVGVGKSKCQAIVAVAKSLANRIRRVLIFNEPYVLGMVK
jgi:transposase